MIQHWLLLLNFSVNFGLSCACFLVHFLTGFDIVLFKANMKIACAVQNDTLAGWIILKVSVMDFQSLVQNSKLSADLIIYNEIFVVSLLIIRKISINTDPNIYMELCMKLIAHLSCILSRAEYIFFKGLISELLHNHYI